MGWQTFKVKDVCSVEKEKLGKDKLPYVGMEDIESGTGRFLGDLLPKSVASSTFKFSDKHVLYGRLRPYLNKVLVPNFEGHCSSEIFPLKPVHNLDRSFLAYWLRSERVVSAINRTCTGARMPRANVKELLEFDIDIPSFDEQKRIVAILDEAFADIDKARALTERNLENARELFESYLQYAFTSQDETWTENNLGSVCEVSSGGTPKKSNMDYWDGDIPWYSSGELNAIHTCSPNEKITPLGLKESNAKLFPKGSLLIGMYDTAALKMSILDRDGAFNQAIAGVKPNQNVNLEFIRYSIEHIKPSLLKLRRGVRQKNLNQNKIKGIPVALPPLDTQNRIVGQINRVYSSVENLLTLNETKLTYLESLKKSLLQKAFTGELTKAA